jgi:hypothetical protein
MLALLAVDQGIGEAGHVTGCLPDFGMHEYGGIDTLDIIAPMGHGLPPGTLDVVLEFHA